jgi:hypothetical protein
MKIHRACQGVLSTFALLSGLPLHAAELSGTFPITSAGTNWNGVGAGNGDSLFILGESNGAYVQRFDGMGNRLQSADSLLSSDSDSMAIAASKRGDYGSTWVAADGNYYSVYLRVFRRDGSVKVPQLKVNTSTSGNRSMAPMMAMNDSGDIVVFWDSWDNRVPGLRMLARVFSSSGVPLTGEIEVSPRSTANGVAQGVAIDKNGNFTCIWISSGVNADVMTRRFFKNGTAMTNTATANTYLPGGQAGMHIAMNTYGQYVIAWESSGQDGNGYGVYAQRFDANGVKLGSEIHVSQATKGNQGDSSVGIAEDGSFAVAWIDDNRMNVPSSQPTVWVRQYRADGTPLRLPDLVADASASLNSGYTSLAMEPSGSFVVAWRGISPGTTHNYTFGRRYMMDTAPVAQQIYSGVPVSGLSGAAGTMRYFKLNVPTGATQITVTSAGGTGSTGDADIYVRLGAVPNSRGADYSSTRVGNTEGLQVTGIPGGIWYVGIYGYAAYRGVTLTVTAK